MVELSTRISNMSYNNVMLFDIAFNESKQYKYKKRDNPNYRILVEPLNERPGLDRIIYSTIYDPGNVQK